MERLLIKLQADRLLFGSLANFEAIVLEIIHGLRSRLQYSGVDNHPNNLLTVQ